MSRLGFFLQHYWIVAVPHFVFVALFLLSCITLRLLVGIVVFVGLFTATLVIQVFALAISPFFSVKVGWRLFTPARTNGSGGYHDRDSSILLPIAACAVGLESQHGHAMREETDSRAILSEHNLLP